MQRLQARAEVAADLLGLLHGGARGRLAHLFDAAAQPRHAAASAQTHVIDPPLTERERQVLDGMSRGKTNNEIGRELFLSEDTVKTHARRLFRKLGVNDRAQAVALGFRSGLVR